MSSKLQSIHFEKSKFTVEEAKKYLRDNGYKPIKDLHIEGNYIKSRLRVPHFKSYRSKKLDNGIILIYGILA